LRLKSGNQLKILVKSTRRNEKPAKDDMYRNIK
jgi:hypothetical protein